MIEKTEIKGNIDDIYTKVYCRFRPINKHELDLSQEKISSFSSDTILKIDTSKEKNVLNFNFDKIFKPESTQVEIYDKCAAKSVENFLLGYNSVIITHGQNGSGKSYTMTGNIDNNNLKGIIPRVVKDVFEFIFDNDNLQFIITVSMIDIYKDKIRDLINVTEQNINNIIIHSNDDEKNNNIINFEGITEKYVSNETEVLKILETGINNKTKLDYNINLNGQFPKSNFIFILKLIQNNKKEGSLINSQLLFLDTSGDENLFSYISQKDETMPCPAISFQKLFKGNYRTSLILTCSPSIFNQSTTLQFLRFGEKIKKIKNKAIINKLLSYDKLSVKLKEAELKIKQLENKISSPKEISEGININNNLSFNEQINLIIELIEKNDNITDLKENILEHINNLNNKYRSDIESLNNNIIEKQNELNNIQRDLINQQTINIQNNKLINEFIKSTSDLKHYKDLDLLMKQITDIEQKIKNFDIISDNNKLNNINDFIVEENIKLSFNNNYNNININESKYTSDKENNKILKLELDKDNDIKYLSLCLEENKDIILELKKEILSLQNKIKILENNTLINERKIRDKNIILESNILELKKKYEESQVKRLILEDNCRKLSKILSSKNVNWINNKEESISINKSLRTPKNVIKVLVGGNE